MLGFAGGVGYVFPVGLPEELICSCSSAVQDKFLRTFRCILMGEGDKIQWRKKPYSKCINNSQ